MLVELEQLIRDLGRAGGQTQAGDVELGHHIFQDLLEGQAASGAMLGGRWHSVLQDATPQSGEL